MKEFKILNQTFIKSNNQTSKIFNRYLYSLIPFILLIIISNLINKSFNTIIDLLVSILVSLLTSIITQYIFNIKNKEKDITKIFKEYNILTISLILAIFTINEPILVIIFSNIIAIVIKNISKKITISSSLYGMLFVILYKYITNDLNTPLTNLSNLSYIDTFNNILKPYGSIIDYTLGLTPYYLSPILSICSFVYLFNKKSIKYNILLTYILIFSFIMLTIGMLNNMNIWYLFFQLTTGNILFLMVFSLGDYPITPITTEGQVIYGIILGLITGILRFIIPELSVILPLILGPILLTKTLNNISYKLKYNHKYYYTIITTCIFITIIATTIINIII